MYLYTSWWVLAVCLQLSVAWLIQPNRRLHTEVREADNHQGEEVREAHNQEKQQVREVLNQLGESIREVLNHEDKEVREVLNQQGELSPMRRQHIRGMEDSEDAVRTKRCKCRCRSNAYPDQWHCCECSLSQSGCFPATATVQLQNEQLVTMATLKPGQKVLTVSESGTLVYSEVRAFMLKAANETIVYTSLTTDLGHQLTLSASHVIFISDTNNTSQMRPIFTQDVSIGDYVLVVEDGRPQATRVQHIQLDVKQGLYVPLTEHGTLLVDGVYTSCYASFNHRLAHIVMSPMRWFPGLFDPVPIQEGIRPYVHWVKSIGKWLLPQGLQSGPSQALTFVTSFNWWS